MAVIGRHLILICLLMSIAEGRFLISDDELISDGIETAENLSCCRHLYGFLPCAENAGGYIFSILVYQVLMFFGDMLIGRGSEVLFCITGVELGGIIFRILRALPQMALMILSGILSDKERAQSQVSVAVGVYAGITVFSLTVTWIACMVTASKSFNEESSNACSPRILIDRGVMVDEKTCDTAKIMLLSLIPYVVLQFVYLFNTSSGKRIITLIALIISASSVGLYFLYQRRSLVYSRVSQVVYGKTEIEREDAVNEVLEALNFYEEIVNGLINSPTQSNVDESLEDKLQSLDAEEKFSLLMHGNDEASTSTSKKETHLNLLRGGSVTDKLSQETLSNFPSSKIDKIMSKILKLANGPLMTSETLIKPGTSREPNIKRIESLFEEFDTNKEGFLSASELKQVVSKVNYRTHGMNDDDVVEEIIRAFDENKNGVIDRDEFVNGMVGYLEKAINAVNAPESSGVIEEFDKMTWKDAVLVFGKQALFMSLLQVLLGIAMLIFLSEPLMTNILQLTAVMNLPSFRISFVGVPLAMNIRALIAALLPAWQKREETASLTFSEIYGGAIMNNIAGLTTLLAIVYAKNLTWDYSSEMLTILAVCAAMGAMALFKTYYLSTCILPVLLYVSIISWDF